LNTGFQVPAEIIIYCDESLEKGSHFSNFYGGALITSDHIDEVRDALATKKRELNLGGELKWHKITKTYAQKYVGMISLFFDFIQADKIKLRVMFTQNSITPQGLTAEQVAGTYFLLYYQFIKNAFGLQYCNEPPRGHIRIRLLLDQFPDTKENIARFKGFVAGLTNNSKFRAARIQIAEEDITEAVSHEHVILQCLDVVLGSIQFRLNDKHLEKADGQKRRGKRTIAKENVYKYINKRIRQIYPNFNIGISTGTAGGSQDRWKHPYRHWLFVAKNREPKRGPGKRKK